jgi:hypothetical protein
MMTIRDDLKSFDRALPSPDETGLPIETWTLDDFDKLAEFAYLRVAGAGVDQRGE